LSTRRSLASVEPRSTRVASGLVSFRLGGGSIAFGSDRIARRSTAFVVDRSRFVLGVGKTAEMGNQGERVASRRVEVFRDACVQSVSSDVKFKRVECASG
jgi:hypothetical protein